MSADRLTGNLVTRCLIVGLGSIGRRHLHNLRALRPSCEVAVLRRSPGSLDASDSDVSIITSMADVGAFGPRLAIIAGPASTHIDVATQLVQRGIPTLIEKPLSHTFDRVEDLRRAAGEAGVPVMVGYNLRFQPSLVAVREALRSGAIGQVRWARAEVGQYLPDWRSDSDYRQGVSAQKALGGGALLELSHEIDFLYWMLGAPDRVTASGGRMSDLEIDVEDCVDLILDYRSKHMMASVHLDFLQRSVSRIAKFVGSEGTLVWDGIAGTVTRFPPGGTSEQLYAPEDNADRNHMYVEELRSFLNAVENGVPVPIDLQQGRDVMAIIDAAQRSMVSGCAEPVNS